MSQEKVYVKRLKKGDVVFYEGDQERLLYRVVSGEVATFSSYGGTREKEISRIRADECFGEMAILENQPRSTTAVAMADCVLMVYPESAMEYFIANNPKFSLSIMRSLSAKLRSTTEEMVRMHRLLLRAEQNAPEDKVISDYIRWHTDYDPNGEARFIIKI